LAHFESSAATPPSAKGWSRQRKLLTGAVVLGIAVAIAGAVAWTRPPPPPPPPPNPYAAACTVFCTGPLLATVQAAGLWNDSKTFVDMPLLADPEEVLAAFTARFPNAPGTPPPAAEVADFVGAYFAPAGNDTIPQTPADWQAAPPQLVALQNATLRDFALAVNSLWQFLGLGMDPAVRGEQQRHSLLWQPYPMVVPGGRFRESYYWDSYWVVMGLLRSGATASATGVVRNLAYLLNQFGFVPNGGRVYYALPGRSQPPLLSAMVAEVVAATGNTSLWLEVLPALRTEYAWWMASGAWGHAVTVAPAASGLVYTLNRYVTHQLEPRPESWAEDRATAAAAGLDPASSAAQLLYSELAAGAETGWDFSSRWFADGVSISTIDTVRTHWMVSCCASSPQHSLPLQHPRAVTRHPCGAQCGAV